MQLAEPCQASDHGSRSERCTRRPKGVLAKRQGLQLRTYLDSIKQLQTSTIICEPIFVNVEALEAGEASDGLRHETRRPYVVAEANLLNFQDP